MKISRKCKELLGRKAWAIRPIGSGRFAASFADGTGQALDALEVLRAAGGQQRDPILLLNKAEDLQQAKRIDLAGRDKQFGFGDAAFWDNVAGDEFGQIAFDAHSFLLQSYFRLRLGQRKCQP